MPPPLDLLTATAHELADAMAAGQVSSADLVTGYLDRIAKYNDSLHAVISTAPRDSVLGIAARLDRKRAGAADIALLMDVMVSPGKSGDLSGGGGGHQSWLTGGLEGICVGLLDPKDWHLPGVVAKPSVEFEKQQVRGQMSWETVVAVHSHVSLEEDILKAYGRLVVAGAYVRRVQLPPLDGLEVDGVSHIARVMYSGFKTGFENYLAGLEGSKVRTLDKVMRFMTDHTDQEFPPESPNMVRLEGAAGYVMSAAERKHAIDEMRTLGRKAIDGCLTTYGVDVILGPADSELGDYYCAAGYPMAHLLLSYSRHNGRPFGACALASEFQ